MVPLIIVIISLLLDGILTNFLPYMVGNLSLFTPLLTIVSLILIYPFYLKNTKKYYLIALITGLIYDLLYTNLLFFNSILFLFVVVIAKYFYKNFEINYLNLIFYTIISISIYETSQALLLVLFNLVPVTFEKLAYKIVHSLLLNIIYVEIIYCIIKNLPPKYRKININ